MKDLKFNIIAAMSLNRGIGKDGQLPWKLKKEMEYFTRITSITFESKKMNAVIMGRRTWECIPAKYKPLSNRLNIILSEKHADELLAKVPDGVQVFTNLNAAVDFCTLRPELENVWVIGGSHVYKAAMEHPACNKIYMTEIQKHYECDTYYPMIDPSKFHLLETHESEELHMPMHKQVEGDISYFFRIYVKVCA